MNNERRKTLSDLISKIEELSSQIQSVLDAEQGVYDNMPENFQQGERGEQSQSAIDAMQSAVDNLDDVRNSLEEASQ